MASAYLDDAVREPSELGDVNAKALIAVSIYNLVQQRNLPVLLALALQHRGPHLKILDPFELVGEGRKLVEVGCKEAEASNIACDMFADGPRKAETVIR